MYIRFNRKTKKCRSSYRIVSWKRFSLFLVELVVILSLVGSSFQPVFREQVAGVATEAMQEITQPIKKAEAAGQFAPTGGNLIQGTEQPITSATAAAAEGVNVGSWKGTLADDAYHWVVASTNSGLDVNIKMGGVDLSGANMLMVETEVDLDATAPNLLFQICDWSSSTGVDTATDSVCTGGGWRTLNLRKAAFNSTTNTQFHFQVYDGYWSNGSNAAYSTPLANFINGSNEVVVRYYSTNSTTSPVSIDFLRIYAVINPVYSPAGFWSDGAGALSGDYTDTVLAVGQTASDDNRNGSAGNVSEYAKPTWSFENIKTYPGMNTIMVRAEHSCSGTGLSYRPRIYNFTTSAWEDLSTSDIACSTTDAINIWAKNNVTIADYIDESNNNELRVGFAGTSMVPVVIRADFIYVMLGTTNTDNAACEISLGTNSANGCASTRDIDTTGLASSWHITTENESANVGHAYYPFDYDNDATLEEAGASHVKFSVTQPANSTVTGLFFASRHMSGTGGTVQASLNDYSGYTVGAGGFLDIGATATTGLAYTDNITVGGLANGGTAGVINNPRAFLDTVQNQMWMRLRTSASGAATNNSVNQWDFAMVSLQWVEDSDHPGKQYQYTPTANTLVRGTEQTITTAVAANAEGVNTGNWKGTLADDAYHWVIASTASGYDANITVGGVQLNGANALIIETEIDEDGTAPATLFQICDWVSSTGVDNVADTQCTNGGWRTLNIRKTAVAPTANTQYHFQVNDGYFSDGSNNPVSTPLSNFVNGSNEIKIRYYSTTNSTDQVAIDFLRVFAFVAPIYQPSAFTNLGSGAASGNYKDVQWAGSFTTSGAFLGSDNNYNGAAGTVGSVADMAWTFRNVKTALAMNTIMARAEVGCSATGVTYKPKIYNYTTAQWEDLTTGTIVCNSSSDVTYQWAKNNITVADYIDESNGNILRFGLYGMGNNTAVIRADYMYVTLGMTNTNSSGCEISFGSGTATDCSKTRDLDATGTYNYWDISPEAESTSFSHDYYALDNNGDALAESAAAGHINFTAVSPTGANTVSVYHAFGYLGAAAYTGAASGAVTGNIRDYSGYNGTTGGFTQISGSGTNTLVFVDNITSVVLTNGGMSGLIMNPKDYVDAVNSQMWLRLRNNNSSFAGINLPVKVDFAMVSLGWVE